MKTAIVKSLSLILFFLASLILFIPEPLQAQRMGHGGGGARMGAGGARTGGGGAGMSRSINGASRPSATRPPSNQIQNKPSSGARNFAPGAGQAGAKGTGDMKGGNFQGNKAGAGNIKTSTGQGNKVSTGNINKGNVTKTGNNINTGNIYINNSRNVVVRPNPRPYPRPPYAYGGYRYSCYHPYAYHPFHPFFWGPLWHPVGFFVATMVTTAIIIDIASQKYYYDHGVYYVQSNGGYTVVEAPPGATIKTLPEGSETVVVNQTTNNYYYGGTYYEKSDSGYTVVPPMAGTVVSNLPEGGEEVKIGDVTYVKVGSTYYQPIKQDGKDMYEVVQVEKES
ncbi:MAG: hypothetical protein JXA23_06410 [Bacteroidales bacterium]|nr:hypothetical protein [Bacteroidales bacterium]